MEMTKRAAVVRIRKGDLLRLHYLANADKCQSGKRQIASGVRRCVISTNVDSLWDKPDQK